VRFLKQRATKSGAKTANPLPARLTQAKEALECASPCRGPRQAGHEQQPEGRDQQPAQEVFSQPGDDVQVLTLVRRSSACSGSSEGGAGSSDGDAVSPYSSGLSSPQEEAQEHAGAPAGSQAPTVPSNDPRPGGNARGPTTGPQIGVAMQPARNPAKERGHTRAPAARRASRSRAPPAVGARVLADLSGPAAALQERVVQAEAVMAALEKELEAKVWENRELRERLVAAEAAAEAAAHAEEEWTATAAGASLAGEGAGVEAGCVLEGTAASCLEESSQRGQGKEEKERTAQRLLQEQPEHRRRLDWQRRQQHSQDWQVKKEGSVLDSPPDKAPGRTQCEDAGRDALGAALGELAGLRLEAAGARHTSAAGAFQLKVRVGPAAACCDCSGSGGDGGTANCAHAARVGLLAAQVRALQAQLACARAAVAPASAGAPVLRPPRSSCGACGGGGGGGGGGARARFASRRSVLQCSLVDLSSLADAQWQEPGCAAMPGLPPVTGSDGARQQLALALGEGHRAALGPLLWRKTASGPGEGPRTAVASGAEARRLLQSMLGLLTVRAVPPLDGSPPRSPPPPLLRPLTGEGKGEWPAQPETTGAAAEPKCMPAGAGAGLSDAAWAFIIEARARAAPLAAMSECLTVRPCGTPGGHDSGRPAGQGTPACASSGAPSSAQDHRPPPGPRGCAGATLVPRLDLTKVQRV
jgi:hypothetical protein